MLLTITITMAHRPATNLVYFLAKHPARCHERDLAQSRPMVFFPAASDECCTRRLAVGVGHRSHRPLSRIGAATGALDATGAGDQMPQAEAPAHHLWTEHSSSDIRQEAVSGSCMRTERRATR
ncbi:hypothetical protein [Thiocystis violacea]|uniref:hypothetical protein n=1 Tax=Thiocystis violacea TaxID=13725 RepID=UPI00190449FB|nr:hypothetical protein [Thiocystis violacea]